MKRHQMKQVSMEVTVGAFMFMVLLALGFFTIILSRENMLQKNYRFQVMFNDVQGLIKGDKVYVHGVDVGRVRDMTIAPRGVRVELSLREKLDLHEGYVVSVESSSVLGGRFVALDPGSVDRPAIPEGAELQGAPTADLIGEATEAVRAVREALGEGGVLQNLEGTMANFRQITDDLAAGKGTLGRLLKEESVYDDLKLIAGNLRSLSDQLEKGEGTIGKLMKDESLYTDVRQVASDLRQVSGGLARGEGTLGRLLAKDDQLYRDLSDAAASIRRIAAGIDKGEGTLGKLTRDSQLYDELNKTVAEVRAMVDDLRETSPVASFSGVILGAF